VSAPLLRAPIPLPDGLGIPAEDWRETPTRVRPPGLSLRQRVEALDARLPRDSSTARRRPAPEALSAKRQRRQQAAERRQPGATPGPPGHHQGLWAPTASVSLFPDGWAWGQPGARLSSSLTRTRAGHAPLCLLQAPLGGGLQGEAWRAARWATRRGPRSTPGDTAHGCQGAWARGQGEAARAGARCPTCAPRCAASPGGKGRSRQGWIGCLRRWAPPSAPRQRLRSALAPGGGAESGRALGAIRPGKACGRAAWSLCSARPKAWQSVWKQAWLAWVSASTPHSKGGVLWERRVLPWGRGGHGRRASGGSSTQTPLGRTEPGHVCGVASEPGRCWGCCGTSKVEKRRRTSRRAPTGLGYGGASAAKAQAAPRATAGEHG
jgi:hypothetical protein